MPEANWVNPNEVEWISFPGVNGLFYRLEGNSICLSGDLFNQIWLTDQDAEKLLELVKGGEQ